MVSYPPFQLFIDTNVTPPRKSSKERSLGGKSGDRVICLLGSLLRCFLG